MVGAPKLSRTAVERVLWASCPLAAASLGLWLSAADGAPLSERSAAGLHDQDAPSSEHAFDVSERQYWDPSPLFALLFGGPLATFRAPLALLRPGMFPPMRVSQTPVGFGGRSCPDDMLEVRGEYCPGSIQLCTEWLPGGLRCTQFSPPSKCFGKTSPRHFCIDRYEWPNKKGVIPIVDVDFYDARDACASKGKRLCKDTEWTLACEGPEMLPYPYGHRRDKEACNIDKPYRYPNFDAWGIPRNNERRAAEIARLDQRVPSGSMERCKSPFGVHDMAGNVDEWVINESGRPFKSGLKGGYWGPVRTRCRPMTTAHDETFAFYQVGFRCCSDPRER